MSQPALGPSWPERRRRKQARSTSYQRGYLNSTVTWLHFQFAAYRSFRSSETVPHPLETLGTHSSLLNPSERESLDSLGYVSLGRLLDNAQLKAIRDRVGQLLEEEGEEAGHELFNSDRIRHPKEEGADRLANLVNKGAVFDSLYTQPKLLAAISTVLGPEIKLSSLNYRAAKPGQGLQKLHVDWKSAVMPGDFKVCNSIWLLDDFTKANGATRLVPKSHLRGKMPEEVMEDPLQSHPDEILLEAPAGTVMVFNSHLWHGGTINHTAPSIVTFAPATKFNKRLNKNSSNKKRSAGFHGRRTGFWMCSQI